MVVVTYCPPTLKFCLSVAPPSCHGLCQTAWVDLASMIHTCERSLVQFGGGAPPAVDFILRRLPVVTLVMTDFGRCSDK